MTGLPNPTTLITVGQELVVAGEEVEMSFESRLMPASTPTDLPSDTNINNPQHATTTEAGTQLKLAAKT